MAQKVAFLLTDVVHRIPLCVCFVCVKHRPLLESFLGLRPEPVLANHRVSQGTELELLNDEKGRWAFVVSFCSESHL